MARPCVLCGDPRSRGVGRRGLKHLQRCGACGLVSVRRIPLPEELREVYSEEYFRNSHSQVQGYEDYAKDRYCILKTARRRLDTIEAHVAVRGRLLDAGCALGFFLEAAQERGWEVEGVDISAHAAGYASRHLGIDVRCGMLEEAGFDPGSFDVITMWDVIEHVPDPAAVLAYCASLLRPGGMLVLSTPDVGSLVARLTGSRWMGFKLAEEHLYYFSRPTMNAALEQAGLKPLFTEAVGKDVSLEFFSDRLRLYVPPAAALVSKVVSAAGLGRASIYVNPRDIMLVAASKRHSPTGDPPSLPGAEVVPPARVT